MHETAAEPVYLKSFQILYEQEWKGNTCERQGQQTSHVNFA